MKHALLIFLLLFIATNGYARIYTCKVNGKIVYSDAPCPSGATRLNATKEELFQEELERICLTINGYDSSEFVIERCVNEQIKAKKYIYEIEEKKYVDICKADYHQNYIEIKNCINDKINEQNEKVEKEKKRQELEKHINELKKKKIEAQQKRLDRIATAKRLGLCYVEYVIINVDGSVIKASVTYTNADGGTEQHDLYIDDPLAEDTLSKTIAFTNTCTTQLYISAQKTKKRGIIGVKILINGHETKSSESSAPYGIASVGM